MFLRKSAKYSPGYPELLGCERLFYNLFFDKHWLIKIEMWGWALDIHKVRNVSKQHNHIHHGFHMLLFFFLINKETVNFPSLNIFFL